MTKDDANAIMFAYRYEIFELENGVPTYGYELAQAVKDGFLVDFLSVESEVKAIRPLKIKIKSAPLVAR